MCMGTGQAQSDCKKQKAIGYHISYIQCGGGFMPFLDNDTLADTIKIERERNSDLMWFLNQTFHSTSRLSGDKIYKAWGSATL